jgi:CRP/FNR family transcriptional regulator, cyclic AMP receptor protein
VPRGADDARIAILAEDPDLAERIPGDRRAQAVVACTGRLVIRQPGLWDATASTPAESGAMAYLIVSGHLLRTAEVGDRRAGVILGPGDLVQPWTQTLRWSDRHNAPHRALTPLRLALLDRRFVTQMASFPELAGALFERIAQSNRELVLNLAIASITRVESRLHLTLWQMASKWGRMRPDGVLLPIKLTHAVMAGLVGCRRPTITTALAELAEQGSVLRVDGGWLLTGEPPAELLTA